MVNLFFLYSGFLWVIRFDWPFRFLSCDWCKENVLAKQLFLNLIRFMLQWFLYHSIIPGILKECVWVEKRWLFGVFKIGIFMKYSLKVFAISASSNRVLSSLTRVILELILTLSEIFGFIIFPKTLVSVTLLMSRLLRLPKRRPSLNSHSYYFRNKVKIM